MRPSKRSMTRRPARTLALLVGLAVVGGPATALAGKGGAFAGGLIAGHVLTNMSNRQERQTRAMEYQAYRGSAASQGTSSSARSTEQRLAELDKLAAGGYITKDEYRRRRQAILDGL
ncbi:MAG: SHOCT domain-containing protein [Myxococcota bacterium]|nr:SHOCT domain-containing protein [Myxococcota bacterium]